MAQIIDEALHGNDSYKEALALEVRKHAMLELGSGTGLGGLFSQALLKADKVYLTDICHQSVGLMKENVLLNSD